MKTEANRKQVAGTHYKKMRIEHWDIVLANGLGYMEGQIIKYVMRAADKNGLEDLKKAQHYLEKLIEWQQGVRPSYDLHDTSDLSELEATCTTCGMLLTCHAPTCSAQRMNVTHTGIYGSLDTMMGAMTSRVQGETLNVVEVERATSLETGDTKRDGYVGYVYEGGSRGYDAYRCNGCRKHFGVPPGKSPSDYHWHIEGVDGDDLFLEDPEMLPGVANADVDTSGATYMDSPASNLPPLKENKALVDKYAAEHRARLKAQEAAADPAAPPTPAT